MIEINLTKVKRVQIKQPEFLDADTVKIINVDDNLVSMVNCKLLLINSNTGTQHEAELTLWDGQDYIDIGVWDNDDVIDRLKELLPTAF